jgi:hypothetical protein
LTTDRDDDVTDMQAGALDRCYFIDGNHEGTVHAEEFLFREEAFKVADRLSGGDVMFSRHMDAHVIPLAFKKQYLVDEDFLKLFVPFDIKMSWLALFFW